MDNNKDVLNDKNNSFPAPPSDLLTFVSSSTSNDNINNSYVPKEQEESQSISPLGFNIPSGQNISSTPKNVSVNNNFSFLNQQIANNNSAQENLYSNVNASQQMQSTSIYGPNEQVQKSTNNIFMQNNTSLNEFGNLKAPNATINTFNQSVNMQATQSYIYPQNTNNQIMHETFNTSTIENRDNVPSQINQPQSYIEPQIVQNYSENNMIHVESTPQENNGMDMNQLMRNSFNEKVEHERQTKKANKWFFALSISSGLVFVGVLLFALFGKTNIFNFFGNEVYYENKQATTTGSNSTVVVTDNKWTVKFDSNKDEREQAISFITQDSDNQKKKCSNENVKKIETQIEEKYGIVAVNFCELDTEFAKEIEKMIGVVFKEFPVINTELTNLTLDNLPNAILASFKSASLFAESTSFGGYPQVYKMSIYLNADYFLDSSFSEMMKINVNSGHFPRGATRTTVVAHEFGHYLSFLAQLHNSKMNKLLLIDRKSFKSYYNLIKESNDGTFSLKILNEAYSNYKNKYGDEFDTLYEFRESISGYAASSDSDGIPLYDETIAEAFHDYYINRSNAKRASLEIMQVLKKYLSN